MESNYKEYLQWKNKENSLGTKISRNVRTIHIIGVVFWFALGHFFVTSGRIDNSLYWTLNLALVIAIFVFAYNDQKGREMIPESVIKTIAYESLKKKQKIGLEIPFNARIKILPVGEGVYEQDLISGTSGIVRRDVGFQIIRYGYKKTGVIGIHPYTGDILGIRWEPTGYTGKETKDRTIVPVNTVEKKEQNK